MFIRFILCPFVVSTGKGIERFSLISDGQYDERAKLETEQGPQKGPMVQESIKREWPEEQGAWDDALRILTVSARLPSMAAHEPTTLQGRRGHFSGR